MTLPCVRRQRTTKLSGPTRPRHHHPPLSHLALAWPHPGPPPPPLSLTTCARPAPPRPRHHPHSPAPPAPRNISSIPQLYPQSRPHPLSLSRTSSPTPYLQTWRRLVAGGSTEDCGGRVDRGRPRASVARPSTPSSSSHKPDPTAGRVP
jgi:hypothetical protein